MCSPKSRWIVGTVMLSLALGQMPAVAYINRYGSRQRAEEIQRLEKMGKEQAQRYQENVRKLQVWAAAIERDPKDVVAHYQRANFCFTEMRQSASALADYNRAIENALRDYARAIEIDPEFAPAYFRRSFVFVAGKEYQRALEDLETALRLKPDAAQSAAQLAVFRFRLPDDRYYDPRQARALATKACELEPDENRCRLLAAICAELGDFPAAEKWERQAVELAKVSRTDYSGRYRDKEAIAPRYEELWRAMLCMPPVPSAAQREQ